MGGGDGSAPDGGAVFRLDGEIWTLSYAGRTVRLRDSKGLRDLAVLVTRPDERTHVSELAGVVGLPRVAIPALSVDRSRARGLSGAVAPDRR